MAGKTLVISEIFPPRHGGSGRWFYELYRRLPTDRFVICAGVHEQAHEFDDANSLHTFRVDLSSPEWGLCSVRGLRFYIRSFFQLRRVVREHGVSMIHCGRCLPEGLFGWLFRVMYRVPFLCYVHGEDVGTATLSREYSLLTRAVMSKSTGLIANCRHSAALLAERWGQPQRKINVLHPGMDASVFLPAARDEQFL